MRGSGVQEADLKTWASDSGKKAGDETWSFDIGFPESRSRDRIG